MSDDPIRQARTVLEQARSTIQEAPENIAAPVAEVLRALDTVLDSLHEMEKRNSEAERNLVLQQALLDDRLLRVENNRLFNVWNRLVLWRRNILRRIGSALSPLRVPMRNSSLPERKAINAEYAKWVAGEQGCLPNIDQAHAVSDAWISQPTFSIILAIRHGRYLSGTLESIQNQVYRHWELCLALDGACKSHVLPLVRDLEEKGGSVRHVITDGSDSAAALNAAADLATGEYLSFVDEAATISPFALFQLAEAVQSGRLDVLYTDEDSLDAEGRRVSPIFKPDWSPDLLTSCMYMGHLLTVRRAAFQQAGGLRSQYAGAHLHDLILRLADAPVSVRRLPRVLYHSNIAGRQVDETETSLVRSATARAIEDAIARREGTAAECVPGPDRLTFLVRRKRPCGEMTAVICSRTPNLLEDCLASLRATAGKAVPRIIVIAHEESGANSSLHKVIQQAGATAVPYAGAFNFAVMNNLGADLAKTPNLLFLNDDVNATCQGWAEMLNEQVSREEVGAAGAVLWYPSHVLQHAGLVAGIGDGIGHIGRHAASSELWRWLQATRNVSAVTGACLAIRKDLFGQLGGFNVLFPNNYNDVDLCFRIRESRLAVICIPVPGLIHRECQSRRGVVMFMERYMFHKRWANFLSQPDPYYSPLLAATEEIALNMNHDPSHRSVFAREVMDDPDRRAGNLGA